jgi:hypothetical protein
MGYTHYFTWQTAGELPPDKWDSITSDFQALLGRLPESVQLVSWNGKEGTSPEVSAERISFNGVGERGHESMVLGRRCPERMFQFCKTARKPYDLAVVALLILIYQHAPEFFRLESDGGAEEWKPALNWVNSVLGVQYAIPPNI